MRHCNWYTWVKSTRLAWSRSQSTSEINENNSRNDKHDPSMNEYKDQVFFTCNERYSKQSAVTELDPVGKHNVGRKSSGLRDMIHVPYLPLALNKTLKIDLKNLRITEA